MTDEGRFYIIENLTQYDLSTEDKDTLVRLGFIFHGEEEARNEYTITSFIWNDLGIEGDAAFDLFDRILARTAP